MGRWGELLFEGDTDLDTAIFISEDSGTEWAPSPNFFLSNSYQSFILYLSILIADYMND